MLTKRLIALFISCIMVFSISGAVFAQERPTSEVTVFVDGEQILTANIISGTDNTKYETPTGTYKLRYKQKKYTFNRSYFTRSVNYWMVFYGSTADDTIGLVAADWLTSFGGSTGHEKILE